MKTYPLTLDGIRQCLDDNAVTANSAPLIIGWLLHEVENPPHEREPPHCSTCSCGMPADETHAAAMLSSEINALPDRVRSFIHDLETRADPAGDVRRAHVAEENAAALLVEIERLRCSLAEVKKEICAVTPDWKRALRIIDQDKRHSSADEPPAAPDMSHPKIQALLGDNARKAIELQIIEAMLEDGYEASWPDGEYWTPLHDKLQQRLSAPPVTRLQDAERLLRECLEDLDFESSNAEILYAEIGMFLDGAAKYDRASLSPCAWQPIETAPSGIAVLCYWPELRKRDVTYEEYIGRVCKQYGKWFKSRDGYGTLLDEVNEPTHWMPLPEPPTPQTKEAAT
jgi:hypothetical protein